MKRLLSLVLAFAGLGTSQAQGGVLLVPSSYQQTINHGFSSTSQVNPVYDDKPSATQGSRTFLSTSSTQSYTAPNGDVHLSGTTSGTTTLSSPPSTFSGFQLNASTTISNRTGYGDNTIQDAITSYSAQFTVTTPTHFTLTVSGSSTSNFQYDVGNDISEAFAQLKNLSGSVHYSFDSFIFHSSSGFSFNSGSYQPGTMTFTGTLHRDTYSFYGYARAANGTAGGTIQDSSSINAVLGLSPAPEPGSLTLLAIGAWGLLGYGWRRYRPSVAV